MAKAAGRDDIVDFCSQYLKVADFHDYCVNGLQVEGKKEIRTIVTGVTYSKKLIEAAIKKNADMVIVHHGIFKNNFGDLPALTGVQRGRLKLLFEHDINLCGFHLPLDAHPMIGNNISLCKLFAVLKPEPYEVGFVGKLKTPLEFPRFVAEVESKLKTRCYVIAGGPRVVKRLGIVSGGAGSCFAKAKAAGADTFLCGDIREDLVRTVEEAEVNFINAGHYNTEKLGVLNLGKLLANKFKIKAEFVDIPCDV